MIAVILVIDVTLGAEAPAAACSLSEIPAAQMLDSCWLTLVLWLVPPLEL